MKLAQLSALSAAVIFASAVEANEMTNDSTLDIHLRNYYLDTSVEKTDLAKDSNSQWAQAISANFSSGFFENIVGVDLGAHYALKLTADDVDGANASLLRNSDNNPGSYGKTSYAVKVNLADMGVAKYGRLFLDTPLLNNSDSRSLPGLTEAFYAEGNFEGANLYGIWATKSNTKTESGFMDLMGPDGDKEAVKVLGGGYDFGNGFASNLAFAQQNNVLRKYFFDASYTTEVEGASIDGNFVYGWNRFLGDTRIEKRTDGVDDVQSTWGVSLSAGMHQATVGVSYQLVSQSGAQFESGWAGKPDEEADGSGYVGPHGMMISDFDGNGQKSWGVTARYDFAGTVDGLTIDGAYVRGGEDAKDYAGDTDESEYNLRAVYALPQVENLTVAARYAKNTSKLKKSGDKTTKSQVRLIVKYDMSVF